MKDGFCGDMACGGWCERQSQCGMEEKAQTGQSKALVSEPKSQSSGRAARKEMSEGKSGRKARPKS